MSWFSKRMERDMALLTRWISCKEAVPKDETLVLFVYEEFYTSAGFYDPQLKTWRDAIKLDDVDKDNPDKMPLRHDVTHWMPMPDAP